MFNRNFFWGMLTTILVVVVLAISGITAMHALNPGSSPAFARDGGFDRQEIPGDGTSGFGQPGFRGRDGGEPGHANFSPLRGIGGLMGTLLIVALVVGAVIGGQQLYKRFARRSAPPVIDEPESPIEAESIDEPDPPAEAGESPEV
jgi:hypothetical protein